MSFFRTHRAQVLRSEQCRSSDLAMCTTFRRLGINPIVYVQQQTVPKAPIIDSYSFSGTTLTINFTPGSNGGSAITNYQYSVDNGTTFTDFSPAVTTSPVTINGFNAGMTYSVLLLAKNTIGIGAASTPLNVTAPTAPLAPTNLTYTTSGTSAIVSFTAGLNGGSPITNYRYSTNGGTSFTTFSPVVTTTPITITGLTAGSTYSVVIQAINTIGNGINSSTLSVTIPASAPSAPTALTSSNVGTTSFTISFTPGATGGSAITNYQYSTNGGTSFTAFSPAVTSSPVTITGLTSNTTYSVLLKAVNSVGTGTSSSALSVTTSKIPGSLLFDGSTRELKLNPGVSVGSGAYTIECWFYNNSGWNTQATNPSNYAALLGHTASTGTGTNTSGAIAVFFADSKTVQTDWNGGGWRPIYGFTNSITLNAWHHFVLVRNSSLIETVFIDGVKATSCGGGTGAIGGQQTNSQAYGGDSVEIGHFYQGYWPGYLTNFRIVPGTAVYDPTAASITVPTAALTNITNTKYLMVGDTVTYDGSSTQTVTNTGGVTQTSSVVPF
jgi:hypothetical protein